MNKFFNLIDKKFKYRILAFIFLTLLQIIFESAGIALIPIFLSFILTPEFILNIPIKFIKDIFLSFSQNELIYYSTFILIGVFFIKSINKKTKVIISIFAGRAADSGKDPIPQFKKSISLAKKYKNVEILWASVREPYNYLQAQDVNCHIITIPPKIIDKIINFGKSYSQLTKETVINFLIDSKKSRFKI